MTPREDDTARVGLDEEHETGAARGPRCEGLLTVLRGPSPGALYTLDQPESVIGRNVEADVPIADDTLSRRHARIRRTGGGFQIEDLGSTNGTFVDGARVRGEVSLIDGARISLGGRTVLRFALLDAMEHEAARRTHELTVRDPLTRAFNRRHLQECLASEVAFANRHATELAVLVVDIDHFKRINDTHGHAAGDSALRVIARALEATVRKEDVLARYGGEEFAVIARGIGHSGAVALAERVRASVARLQVPSPHGTIRLTVSVGVAHREGEVPSTPDALLELADGALYAAKRAGRNRVESASAGTRSTGRRLARSSRSN